VLYTATERCQSELLYGFWLTDDRKTLTEHRIYCAGFPQRSAGRKTGIKRRIVVEDAADFVVCWKVCQRRDKRITLQVIICFHFNHLLDKTFSFTDKKRIC